MNNCQGIKNEFGTQKIGNEIFFGLAQFGSFCLWQTYYFFLFLDYFIAIKTSSKITCSKFLCIEKILRPKIKPDFFGMI